MTSSVPNVWQGVEHHVLVRCGSLMTQLASALRQVSVLERTNTSYVAASQLAAQSTTLVEHYYSQLADRRAIFAAHLRTPIFQPLQLSIERASSSAASHMLAAARLPTPNYRVPPTEHRVRLSTEQLVHHCHWSPGRQSPSNVCRIELACPIDLVRPDSRHEFVVFATHLESLSARIQYSPRSHVDANEIEFVARSVPLVRPESRNGQHEHLGQLLLLRKAHLESCTSISIELEPGNISFHLSVMVAEFYEPLLRQISFGSIGMLDAASTTLSGGATPTPANGPDGAPSTTDDGFRHELLVRLQITGVSNKHFPYAIRLVPTSSQRHSAEAQPADDASTTQGSWLFPPLGILRPAEVLRFGASPATKTTRDSSQSSSGSWSKKQKLLLEEAELEEDQVLQPPLCNDELFLPDLGAHYLQPIQRHFTPHLRAIGQRVDGLDNDDDDDGESTFLDYLPLAGIYNRPLRRALPLEDVIDIVFVVDPHVEFEVRGVGLSFI